MPGSIPQVTVGTVLHNESRGENMQQKNRCVIVSLSISWKFVESPTVSFQSFLAATSALTQIGS